MSRHTRAIDNSGSSQASGGLRTRITFNRSDLLIRSELIDPVTESPVRLPVEGYSKDSRCGPNILDALQRETKIVKVKQLGPDGKEMLKEESRTFWKKRDIVEIFLPKKARDEKRPLDIFKSQYLAGGKVIDEDDDYVWVEKPSSVSISTLTLKLAEAMEGSYEGARYRVSDLAAEAWKEDVERAMELYELIETTDSKEISDGDVPQRLKAVATISQVVEAQILKSACLWFGVDPDKPLPKQRAGKRAQRKPRQHTTDEEMREELEAEHDEGEYIRIILKGEAVTGSILKDFDAFAKGTDLASLSLISLVELLGSFRQKGLELDADFLHAYLDASWPSWEERVGGAAESSGESEDPWEILGIDRGSGAADVKKAYHKAMMAVHPDKSGLSNYFAMQVSRAYKEILGELS